MNATIYTEDIDEFAADAVEKSRPETNYYRSGVSIGWTAPAKWWNWLWGIITRIVMQHKADIGSMRNEIIDTLQSAELEPADETEYQLSNSITYRQILRCEFKDEKPYVSNHRIYFPANEIL